MHDNHQQHQKLQQFYFLDMFDIENFSKLNYVIHLYYIIENFQ